MAPQPSLCLTLPKSAGRGSKLVQRLAQLSLLIWLGFAAARIAVGSPRSEWSLRVWQSDDGLPNNNVTGLAQTPDGYLWMATSGHFARFDGVQIEELTASNSLPAYAGYTERGGVLLQDSKGGLWFAMVHGAVACLKSGRA